MGAGQSLLTVLGIVGVVIVIAIACIFVWPSGDD
jgi:hypothetical protein